MKVLWHFEKEVPESIIISLQEAADRSLLCEGITVPCAVSVLFCDDKKIAEMNTQFRQISKATDVLSFPTVQFPEGKTAGACINLLRKEYDDELEACYLGDIIISVDHARTQAMEYGHSFRREAGYLMIHGLCHLMGYDHMTDEEKGKMRKMEEKILSDVSLSREEKDTSGFPDDDQLLQTAREAMKMSYSPYSGFPVGAALLCSDGSVYTGCNVENASFGLTNCAERTAVFKAVSEGKREFTAIAIAAKSVAWPCGACRQVLNEFAPDLRVMVTWENQVREMNLKELLPGSFGPKDLL